MPRGSRMAGIAMVVAALAWLPAAAAEAREEPRATGVSRASDAAAPPEQPSLFATSDDDAGGAATPAEAEDKGDDLNTGQDFTKPLARLDIRLKHQRISDDFEAEVLTLRADVPFRLESGWQVSTRLDVPIVRNDVPSRDNPYGDYETGMGDVLGQVLLITPPLGRSAFGFGTQVLLPTASQDQFGTGKYQLAPTLGGLYYPESLPKGSFVGGLVRYQFDVAGDDDRPDIEDLVLQPIVNVNLPRKWFVTLQPEIRMSREHDDEWFVPFDVMVGKLVTKKVVASFEYKEAIIDGYHVFDREFELRIGFFF